MDLPLPTERRDRLLAALLAADPRLVLLRWDAEAAVLLGVEEPRRILLVTVPPDLPQDRLRHLFSTHVKTITQGSPPTHVVAIGGGPEVATALTATAPFVEVAPMGFDHVDDDGVFAHLKSQRLPILDQVAAAGIDVSGPLDPEPIAAALARGQKLVDQERAFARKLTGRHAVTTVITVICVALAGLGYLWGGSTMYGEALWRMGANSVEAVRGGEPWRLLASAFLHANVVHLVVNMIALWSFGPMLEAIFGRRRYVLLYGGAALGGALASAFLGGAARTSVGASGAIWGLMAAFLALALWPRGVIPPLMAAALRRQAWMPIGINLAYSLQAGVDMLAHVGGGVVGFVLVATVLTRGLVPVDERRDPHDIEKNPGKLAMVGATLVAAAMALSVIAAVYTGRPWELRDPPVLARMPIADTGLTVEVPRAAAPKVESTKEEGLQLVGFGSLLELPVAFEVVVTTLPRAVEPEEMKELLGELEKQMNEIAPAKWTRVGPAQQVTLGDRTAIAVEHTVGPNGVKVKTYRQVLGTKDVLIRCYSRKERPEAWKGIEEKVAASLRGP
jgi:membrane associated rhomboid family serine protease